jgi:hypothetical protein
VSLGTFRKLPPPSFLPPYLLAMAPRTRTPSSWHHRLPRPSSLGIPTNHPLQPPLLTHHLRLGSGLRLVTAAIPLTYTRGFSRSHPLLFTRAQGLRHPLNPTSLNSGGQAPILSLPGTSGRLPLLLGLGLTTLRSSHRPFAHF